MLRILHTIEATGCLPKDTKQLLANYKQVPQNLIEAIVKSNDTRKDHITRMILRKNPKTVGIYRLTMKTDSDNFRASAIQGIIDRLKFYNININIVIYEPTLKTDTFNDCKVINDFDEFSSLSDVVLVNRKDDNTKKIQDKVYTQDKRMRNCAFFMLIYM